MRLSSIVGVSEPTEAAFRKRLTKGLIGQDLPDRVVSSIVTAAAIPDCDAPPITDRRGDPLADPDLRDAENIALPEGWLRLSEEQREAALVEQADAYLSGEIRQFWADAWIDHTKTKIGYEVPFAGSFYVYVPPRSVSEIDEELRGLEGQVQRIMGELGR